MRFFSASQVGQVKSSRNASATMAFQKYRRELKWSSATKLGQRRFQHGSEPLGPSRDIKMMLFAQFVLNLSWGLLLVRMSGSRAVFDTSKLDSGGRRAVQNSQYLCHESREIAAVECATLRFFCAWNRPLTHDACRSYAARHVYRGQESSQKDDEADVLFFTIEQRPTPPPSPSGRCSGWFFYL